MSTSFPDVKNATTYLSRHPGEGSGDEAEGSSSLHDGARTVAARGGGRLSRCHAVGVAEVLQELRLGAEVGLGGEGGGGGESEEDKA